MLCLARSTRVAPATTSVTMVREVIRGYIGFDGLLMSDDVSMNALSGTLARAQPRASLAAGCDLVLHCNGKLDEMRRGRGRVRRRSPATRSGAPMRRSRRGARLQPFDVAAARARFGMIAG